MCYLQSVTQSNQQPLFQRTQLQSRCTDIPKQFLTWPCDEGVGNVWASQVKFLFCSRGFGLRKVCHHLGKGHRWTQFGLTGLLDTDNVHAVQTNHTIKPLKQHLCNFKIVEALFHNFTCKLVKTSVPTSLGIFSLPIYFCKVLQSYSKVQLK